MENIKNIPFHQIKQLELERIVNEIHDKIPPELVEPVIGFIAEAIYQNISIDKNDFELSQIRKILQEIDIYLSDKYRLEGFVNEKNKENSSDKPLTLAVELILRSLFKNEGSNNWKLHIYYVLEGWILKKVAERVGHDTRLNKYNDWIKILYLTEVKHGFFQDWTTSINIEFIEKNKDELMTLPPSKEIFEKSRYFNESYYTWYKDQSEKDKDKPKWNFVWENTRNSDRLFLSLKLLFNRTLIKRLDTKVFLEWWDNLELPIIQDNVLISLKGADEYVELIDVLLNSEYKTKTDKTILLLIILKNTFSTVTQISQNLQHYTNENLIKEVNLSSESKTIFENGIEENKKWSDEEMRMVFQRLFTLIFPSKSEILLNNYFNEVNDWVTSYGERELTFNRSQTYYNNCVKVIKEVFETFLKEINIVDYLKSISKETLHWGIFEQIQKIAFSENKDVEKDTIRDIIMGLYIYFISNIDFFWDQEINNANINKFRAFAKVVSLYDEPMEEHSKLIEQYENYSEGWRISEIDVKNDYKELFIFCSCVLMIELAELNQTKGSIQDWFDLIFNATIEKYRFHTNYADKKYYKILVLIGTAVATCAPSLENNFLTTILNSGDDIDQIIYLFSLFNPDKVELDLKEQFQKYVDLNYWILKEKMNMRNQGEQIKHLDDIINKYK